MQLIFEKSVPGRKGFSLPGKDVPDSASLPANLLRKEPPALPEISELQIIRHYTELSRKNFGIDTHFYPLGSCTMKYNPKICEQVASLPGFTQLHPLLPQLRQGGLLTQGALQVLYDMERLLSECSGMAEVTMQPLAGAHGELTGMMIVDAYHKAKGTIKKRVIIPDSAHGTNPASSTIAGYRTVSVPTGPDGTMDIERYKEILSDDVAAIMLTCPNTLGIFNPRIAEVARMAHEFDALVYGDGANLNAILGKVRPGDIGFDLVHINLHKTFATPHGGGGPGAGPVGVVEKLTEFLPVSLVVKRDDGTYTLQYDRPSSIGYIAPFYGNFLVILKAYAWILLMGCDGLNRVSDDAVLNANYMKERLKKHYPLPYDTLCKHEFVLSAAEHLDKGLHAMDYAKGIIDRGFHPPTVNFPLIVKEALMIEPTESESRETLDRFIEAMIDLAELAKSNPQALKDAPITTPVSRLDEVAAARNLDLAF